MSELTPEPYSIGGENKKNIFNFKIVALPAMS
jgi:hypothetical protein